MYRTPFPAARPGPVADHRPRRSVCGRRALVAATLLALLASAVLPEAASADPSSLDCPGNFEPTSPCGATDAGAAPASDLPSTTLGNPVSLVTGNKRQAETDYRVAGGALAFTRHYASAGADANVGLGYGWRHTYLVQLFATGNGGRLVVDSTGRHIPFTPPAAPDPIEQDADEDVTDSGDGPVVHVPLLPSDGHLQVTGNDAVWVVPDGRRLSFHGSFLVRIDWPDRRHLALHYRQQRLAKVTDESGRVLVLDYTPGTRGALALPGYDPEPHRAHAGHLAALTLPDGSRLEYDYDERQNLTRARFPDGTSRDYHYEDPLWPSHLSGLTDRTGTRFASWTYDERGRAASSTHADGVERVSLRIEAPEERSGEARGAGDDGRTLVTAGDGATSVYRWRTDPRSGASQLLSGTGPGCATCPPTGRRYAYERGRLVRGERLGENGRVLVTHRREHDERGRLVRTVETLHGDDGSTVERTLERREYDGDSHRLRLVARPSVNPAGERTTETRRGPDGLPTAIVERGFAPVFVPASGAAEQPSEYAPLERTTRFVHDAGRLVAVDGPRDDVDDTTRFEWDERARLVAIHPPASPSVRVTRFDAHGQVAEVRIGGRQPFTLERDGDGHVIAVRQGELVVRYGHDAEGRLRSITDADGRLVRLDRDAAGRLVTVTDDLGRRNTIGRDEEGRVTARRAFAVDGSLIRSVDFLFDAHGRLASTTARAGDAASHAVTDPLARTLRLVDPDGASTRIGFDAVGRDVSLEDARGNETRYPTDDFGRVVLLDSPDGGRVRYRHDAADNRVEAIDASGRVTRFAYDAADRPISRTDVDGTTRWRWDETAGTLLEASNPVSTERFAHDAETRLISHVREIDGHRFETTYAYDARGRLSEKRLPDGRTLHHHYHEHGPNRGTLRAITRTRWFGLGRETIVADIDLDPRDGTAGHLSHDGSRRRATFAPNGEIRRLEIGGKLAFGYRFDDTGRIVAIDENGTAGRYGYTRGRLTSASTPLGEFRYAYDAVGNRLSTRATRRDGSSRDERHRYAASGDGNRLLESVDEVSGRTTTYRHDGTGAPVAVGALDYTRDANGRQLAVHRDGRLVATYAYNAFGERVRKVVYQGGEPPLTTYFLHEGQALVAEADAHGTLTAQYVYLDTHRLVARIAGDELHAIHTDHLGTPRAMTDGAGRTVWRADYTPFGEAIVRQADVALPLRLPGQYADAETGTHANYLRDYDPRTGRYTTPDPIGLDGGTNLYAYVSADPLGASDPLGLFELATTPEAERLIRDLRLERAVERALQPASQPVPPPRPGPPVRGVLSSMTRVAGLAALAATAYEIGYQGAALADALIFQPADRDDLLAQIVRYDPDYRPATRQVSLEHIRDLASELYALQLDHLATHASGSVCPADPQLYTDTRWAVAMASNEPRAYVSPEGIVFPSREAYEAARFNYDAARERGETDLSFGEWYARGERDRLEGGTSAPPANFRTTVTYEGEPSTHERQVAEELADRGHSVTVRGDNVPGPDFILDGTYWDLKGLRGAGRNSLRNSIKAGKDNFDSAEASSLGLTRSDTRVIVDVRGNSTWDDTEKVRNEISRFGGSDDFRNVRQVRVITSGGIVTWP